MLRIKSNSRSRGEVRHGLGWGRRWGSILSLDDSCPEIWVISAERFQDNRHCEWPPGNVSLEFQKPPGVLALSREKRRFQVRSGRQSWSPALDKSSHAWKLRQFVLPKEAKGRFHPYPSTPKPMAILLEHSLFPELGASWSKNSKPVSRAFQSSVSKHQTGRGKAEWVGRIMGRTWLAVWPLDGAELSGLHLLPIWGAWFLRHLLEEPAIYLYF